MKSRSLKILTALLVTILVASGSYWQVNFNKDWHEEYAYAKGIDAMVYSFPYQLNSALLYKWSQTKGPEGYQGPVDAVNHFWHTNQPANPKIYSDGGMPNVDTLYSVSWVYAKDQPVIISVPEIPNDRFYSFQIAGFDSDNFAYISKRLHGNGGGNYAIVPPGWQGELPKDVEFLAHNPTSWFLTAGRTFVDPNDPQDSVRVNALQQQYKIVALSDWGKETPPRPAHPPIADMGKLSEMLLEGNIIDYLKRLVISDPLSYWENVNHAMTVNGVPMRDRSRLADWAMLKIGPNQDISQANPSALAGLKRSVMSGMIILKDYGLHGFNLNVANGWFYPPKSTGRSGIAGDYLSRSALQSMKGIIANDAQEAVYIPVRKDQFGEELNGDNSYEIHFKPDQIPKATNFWSLTAYDIDGNLILNPIDRYAVGDRSKQLTYEADGGLRIFVGKTPPKGKESNWLPIADGYAILMLRVYGPGEDVIAQTWQPPSVLRL